MTNLRTKTPLADDLYGRTMRVRISMSLYPPLVI